MKITATIIAGLFMVLFLAGPGFATSQTIDGTNNSVADDTGGGNGIDPVDLSPNVSVLYNSLADEYEMSSVNSKGTFEYGISSESADVFMHEATITDGEAVLSTFTSTDGTAITSWTPMGGTASGS